MLTCFFAHLQNAHLHRYLDSQYVTADDSVLSFLNLTEVAHKSSNNFISDILNTKKGAIQILISLN